MAAPRRPNSGYLNTNKKNSEKQPDFRAEIPVDSKFIKGLADAAAKEGGAFVYMAGWKGVSQKTGDPYVSLQLTSEKYQPPERREPQASEKEETPF